MFPNPVSSRVLVRKSLAATTKEIGNIFAGEVEAFLAEEARARRGVYEKVQFVGHDSVDSNTKISPKEKRVRNIAKRVIIVAVCFPVIDSDISDVDDLLFRRDCEHLHRP